MEKSIVQHRALIKAVLQGCPLTGFPVNLPFNWRGHKKKGAASIPNFSTTLKLVKKMSETDRRRKRERDRMKERLTEMSLADDQAKIGCKHVEGLIGMSTHLHSP